jgi:hypothetical protein
MPKSIPEHELQAIEDIIAVHPAGVQVDTIRQKLPFALPPRMLQRRLALLIQQKRLFAEGRGRGRRYRAAVAKPESVRTVTYGGHGEIYPPISVESAAIRQAVCQPIHQRRPVGYQQDFLADYRPNVSFYLDGQTRQRLLALGRSQDMYRPAGTHVLKVYGRLLIDLSWNSSRLEGNTYSLLETERLLELGEAAEGRDLKEAQMLLNHKAAIELLVEQAGEIGFNTYTILNLHALLSDNLLTDSRACGRLRSIAVAIGGTVYHPLEVPQRIDENFRRILDIASAIDDPLEQSFFAMVHLAYLQPFEDVNKRVSRLAANIPLIKHNLSPLSFVDVPERAYIEGILGVYELNHVDLLRDVFIWAYERSCARYSAMQQSLGEPDPFRLRYRTQVAEMMSIIVREFLDKKAAVALIRQRASESVPLEERARFMELAETEITGLHEGNMARYRIRPAEYAVWKSGWR